MIKETNYHKNWQQNRIDFILSKYPKEFFKGKRILELGAYNGYIGAYFSSLGANVHCLDGRIENVVNIKNDYPNVKADVANLDTPDWIWGHWDIIINFGLYYHLEKFHKEHLVNCINNCDLMFFETVVYDSFDDKIFFRPEYGDDQSLSTIGGTPTTSHVENIFKQTNVNYTKYSDSFLNGNNHHYNWVDTGNNIFDEWARRFWIVNK
jgi:hypothetical protein